MNHVKIRKTSEADYNAVAELLKSASLPTEGVVEHFQHFLVAENDSGIVATIGLEVYGDMALLRSAVVHPSLQNKGLGSLLYNHLIENARSLGVRRLILLTNTAEKYFAKKGFQMIDAKSVSGPITRSVEFTGACPSTAACMELILNPERSEGSRTSEILRSPQKAGRPQNGVRVLILCTGNSCRSQMAEAFLKSFDHSLEVYSAGTKPSIQVHPNAVAVMKEVGIDLNGAFPKHVDRFINDPFDYVITVCDNAKETCPVFVGKVQHRLHISFDDPAKATGTEEEALAVFRRVRDEIHERFFEFYIQTIKNTQKA